MKNIKTKLILAALTIGLTLTAGCLIVPFGEGHGGGWHHDGGRYR